VDDIEFPCPRRNGFEQQRTGGIRIDMLSTKAQRARPHRMEISACFGIPTGKERNLMSEID
jgi:hypothetical protein